MCNGMPVDEPRVATWRSYFIRSVLVAGMFACLTTSYAAASDRENCLLCHRFRGLSRLDPETNELRLFFCSAEYYAHRQGQHARVDCTGCHESSEVVVIPHQVKTPVDCTRTCHITPATGVSLRFSHSRVAGSLYHSVHSQDLLRALEFDAPLLRPGQSTCLYCHDQPTFGFEGGIPEGFESHSGGTRCDTCHAEEIPLEITYFANHVAARMKPARPVKQLLQVCAVCHSDPKILEQTGQHDAVASYLHSFHGKASLLGSTDTATCLECHSSETGDQHLIRAKDDPASSTYPVNLPDTCRTTQCHPGAPPEMSSAAVHLQLDPGKRTPEFYVAAFFVLMTAGVMAVFFLWVVLESLNALMRPTNPEHQRLVRLAKHLLAHPQARALLRRMTLHQRLQHWGLAIPFILLVLTGMPIKFAEAHWARSLVDMFGGLSVARMVHRAAGVTLIGVFIYHLIYLLVMLILQIRRDRVYGRRIPLWKRIATAPLVPTLEDARQFLGLFAYLAFLRPDRPRFGRFNILQKFEYWAVFWGMPVMGLSGLALWGTGPTAEHLSGRALNFAFIIHSDEAYLAFIYIAAIHLFSVIFAPVVFPLSLGTLTGDAPAAELVEGHEAELERIGHEIGITDPPTLHERASFANTLRHWSGAFFRRTYAAAVVGIYTVVAFISLRFLVTMLVSHQAAPIEIVDIPKRLEPQTYFAATALPVEVSPEGLRKRPRGPLAHFHQIPHWFQPDPRNSCTTAGCHAPLPHGNRVEVRAFLNMHTTFTDCMVCHREQHEANTVARWVKLPEREAIDAPAVLKLANLLEELRDDEFSAPFAISERLQALVQASLPASGENPQLRRWLARLETTHPQSRLFHNLVNEMADEIHMHVHGEYGAKVGLFDGNTLLGSPTAAQDTATRAFLRLADNAPATERENLLTTVHAGIAPMGALCTPCHDPNPTLVDFRELEYPQTRLNQLYDNAVMRSVLSIEQGKPFYLPVSGNDEQTP